jgi:hypothetical protein
LVLIGFGVRAFILVSGNWIIGAQQLGFPFYFQRFDISHGDTYTQAGIASNGSFGEGTWAQKSPGRRKKKRHIKRMMAFVFGNAG